MIDPWNDGLVARFKRCQWKSTRSRGSLARVIDRASSPRVMISFACRGMRLRFGSRSSWPIERSSSSRSLEVEFRRPIVSRMASRRRPEARRFYFCRAVGDASSVDFVFNNSRWKPIPARGKPCLVAKHVAEISHLTAYFWNADAKVSRTIQTSRVQGTRVSQKMKYREISCRKMSIKS